METNEHSVAVGVFEDRARAEQAIGDLKQAGFTDEQVGYAARDEQAAEPGMVATEEGHGGTREGLAMGAITGASFGSIVGAAAALLLPGIGPVIAGGILGAALTGAAIGAATGGIAGALREWGLPEEEVQYYRGEFEAGRTIVTVHANGRQQEAMAILRRNGAYDAGTRATATTTTPTSTTTEVTPPPATTTTTTTADQTTTENRTDM